MYRKNHSNRYLLSFEKFIFSRISLWKKFILKHILYVSKILLQKFWEIYLKKFFPKIQFPKFRKTVRKAKEHLECVRGVRINYADSWRKLFCWTTYLLNLIVDAYTKLHRLSISNAFCMTFKLNLNGAFTSSLNKKNIISSQSLI